MNWISNWLYENAIKCRIRGWWFRVRFNLGKDEGPYQNCGLYNHGMFHENAYQVTGAYAEAGQMKCEDCGRMTYL